MDYIEGLAKQASQITMYDVKSYYNQAKSMVLNLSEMESKVREATNDDPWGASSTLMQEIADGTHNFAQFNEIMPCIYSRFMEKEAREWRQIYKALTLLEFLVKNGSERVVDDARAHVSTIKMLRSFHYVDEKGKDQGINVRNRSSEIALMLGDVDKIRQERRKAKANKTKYRGQGNDGGMSFVTAGGSRYGGFGSESVGGAGGGGGGGGGSRYGTDYDASDDYRPSRSSSAPKADAEYDEYEGADDFEDDQPPKRTTSASASRSSRPNPPPKAAKKEEPPKPAEKPKEVDLFDFDDDDAPLAAAAAPAAPAFDVGGDDDFDDFQSAPSVPPTASAPAAAPKPAGAANSNLFDLFNSSTPPAVQQQSQRAPSFASPAPTPSYGMAPLQPPMQSRPSYTSSTVTSPPAAPASKPSASSGFDDLWTSSLSTLGSAKPTSAAPAGRSINDLEKEKAMHKLWGPTPGAQPAANGGLTQQPAQSKSAGGSNGFDDLLM